MSGRQWIHLRLVGWGLLGVWQLLSLVNALGYFPVGGQAAKVIGPVLSLTGIALVGLGFEALIHSKQPLFPRDQAT
jgi:hypothetical protein